MTYDKTAEHPDFNIHPDTRIGYVSLNVSHIDRSLDFYEKVLGFSKVDMPSNGSALLSVEGSFRFLIELLKAKEPTQGYSPYHAKTIRRAGLYHFAILLPERKYLADMLQNLSERRDEIRFDGLADHLVSESIYIRDPDNIGIEIYCDKPSSQWEWEGTQVRMATNRLDTEDLLSESTSGGWNSMPTKTVIGHVHLHVRNLEKAMKFYHDTFGLNYTASYPGASFFAAGRYHHHIATNIWLGPNIQLASSEDVGLNHFSVDLPNEQHYEKTAEKLRDYKIDMPKYERSKASTYAFFRDTNGITIQLSMK